MKSKPSHTTSLFGKASAYHFGSMSPEPIATKTTAPYGESSTLDLDQIYKSLLAKPNQRGTIWFSILGGAQRQKVTRSQKNLV
jgi:hypothetical protein